MTIDFSNRTTCKPETTYVGQMAELFISECEMNILRLFVNIREL